MGSFFDIDKLRLERSLSHLKLVAGYFCNKTFGFLVMMSVNLSCKMGDIVIVSIYLVGSGPVLRPGKIVGRRCSLVQSRSFHRHLLTL